jgi:hypothetical protein
VSERKRKEEAVERKENRSSLFFFFPFTLGRGGSGWGRYLHKKKNLEIRPNQYRLEEIQPVFTKKKKKNLNLADWGMAGLVGRIGWVFAHL